MNEIDLIEFVSWIPLVMAVAWWCGEVHVSLNHLDD